MIVQGKGMTRQCNFRWLSSTSAAARLPSRASLPCFGHVQRSQSMSVFVQIPLAFGILKKALAQVRIPQLIDCESALLDRVGPLQ